MLSARCLLRSSRWLDLPFFFGVSNMFSHMSMDGCLPAQSVGSCTWASQQAPAPSTDGAIGERSKQPKRFVEGICGRARKLSTALPVRRAAPFLFYFLFSHLKSEVIHGKFEKLGLDECAGLCGPCEARLVWRRLQGEPR